LHTIARETQRRFNITQRRKALVRQSTLFLAYSHLTRTSHSAEKRKFNDTKKFSVAPSRQLEVSALLVEDIGLGMANGIPTQ